MMVETNSNASTVINNSYTNYFVPPSRQLLIFKHNPKAGGGSIEQVLLDLKPNYRSNEDAFPDFYRNDNNNIKTKNHTAVSLNNNTTTLLATKKDHTLIIVHESQRVGMLHRQEGFVISNIREPCDQYVSLWAFGSAGHGSLHRRNKKRNYNWTLAAYGHDSPTFDSQEDIKRFQQLWLPDPNIRGIIAKRFREGYGRPMANGSTIFSRPSSVDCWVYVDDFKATLYSCLREYEMQGGLVDWDAPLLSALVKRLQQKNAKRKLGGNSKNDPIGKPQLSHHAKCRTYYDNVTADIVQLGDESYIFKAFGYQGCCRGRNPKSTLIHPPPLISSPEVNDFGALELNQQMQENVTFGYLPGQSLIAIICALGIVLILVVRRLQNQRAGHLHRYAAAKQDKGSEEI